MHIAEIGEHYLRRFVVLSVATVLLENSFWCKFANERAYALDTTIHLLCVYNAEVNVCILCDGC